MANSKGDIIMKKVIKKIATVVASVSMVAAMSVAAFADESVYSFVGNPNLFNEADQGNDKVGWHPEAEEYVMEAAEGLDGVYQYKSTYVKPSEETEDTLKNSKQFKLVKDGEDNAWSFQACIGMPDSVWADNQTQFDIADEAFTEGEFTVYVRPADGYVAVVQNKKAMALNVRYHSRDEDPSNFVPLCRANILAEDSIENPGQKAYDEKSVYFDDDKYLEFLNTVVANEGGEAIDALPGIDASAVAPADDTTATEEDTKAAETTKKADKEEDSKSYSTVIIVIVVVVVVIAIAGIVLATKKKDN